MRKLALPADMVALAAKTPSHDRTVDAPTCPASCITEYPVPVRVAYNAPFGIAHGPGGMCFGNRGINGRISSDRNFTEYALPHASPPAGWPADAYRNRWLTHRGSGKIGGSDSFGRIIEYTIPTPNSLPEAVLQDRDGIVWFPEQAGNKIGRLAPFAKDQR